MGKRIYTTIALVLLALASLSAVSFAWFSIADFTRVSSLNLTVTTGISMRFDLQPHETFDEYIRTLGFDEIGAHIQEVFGYDPNSVPLEPVTTRDGAVYTLENGTIVRNDEGKYLEFTLHFIATKDMIVHLTSSDALQSEGGAAGTLFESSTPGTVEAMRISFTADGVTYIYDPDFGDRAEINGKIKTFGLPSGDNMVYNNNNAMFSLEQETDKPVVVRIWLEGTDEKCVNSLKGSEFSIRLRFEGTDQNNSLFSSRQK
ncbi:MAG: hypothetical protein IJP43_08070 [Oscillospiraceae bacterium]|nr:hypothetical protein [Oscillospiraceae bacterium]